MILVGVFVRYGEEEIQKTTDPFGFETRKTHDPGLLGLVVRRPVLVGPNSFLLVTVQLIKPV